MLPHDMDELFSPILHKPGATPLEGCVLSIRCAKSFIYPKGLKIHLWPKIIHYHCNKRSFVLEF